MDLFNELESLAVAAVYEGPGEDDDSPDANTGTIKMWQDRFGYSYEEAVAIIRIAQNATKPSTSTQQGPNSGKPCNDPRIQPRKSVFYKVDGRAKIAIENWLSKQSEHLFRPLFIPVRIAYKELSSQSLYPTLGKNTTLPQFRPQDPHLLSASPSFGRTQNEFPVWYFFYGTLAGVPKICTLFSLSGDGIPILYDASVRGGKMDPWGNGKYKALVNGSEESYVKGSAYQVMSEEHVDALRKYETDEYEAGKLAEICD
ncbi:hypothetical protein VE02_02869 [Pseudogymnoascus sp. 03VT05]|nr:hypothetical protein VE02_02869 [Pseudogymnoascus sp. 03VT05]